jgi:antitoxin ParD1/3/4
MNISLTEELEQFVHAKVESGKYLSASEVVRAGLRLLHERDQLHQQKLDALRKDVQQGLEQAERGESIRLDNALADDIKASGRKRQQKRKAKKS